MNHQHISTGEAAKMTGLTIRTLQHYDNIGVLPASGRTANGRRYYTEYDIVKLEHLVFYRGLGFSLAQIKKKLLDPSMNDGVAEALARQEILLYNQIDHLQNSIAAIEACKEIAPATPIAQQLAAGWEEMVKKATGGKPEHEQAYLAVDHMRDRWNQAERELLEKAEWFLEEALKIYRQNNEKTLANYVT